eukprot:219675-Rhodomonas_salina.1
MWSRAAGSAIRRVETGRGLPAWTHEIELLDAPRMFRTTNTPVCTLLMIGGLKPVARTGCSRTGILATTC